MTDDEINALSKEEKIRWFARQTSLRKLDLGAAPQCQSLPELRAAVAAYVSQLAEQQGIGSTLVNLNRRFGVQASRLGTTVRQLCRDLVESGAVLVEVTPLGAALIFDAAFAERAQSAGALPAVIDKTRAAGDKKRHSVE